MNHKRPDLLSGMYIIICIIIVVVLVIYFSLSLIAIIDYTKFFVKVIS